MEPTMTTTLATAEVTTEPTMNVVDGRRPAPKPKPDVIVAGLDFPVSGGGVVRLPYPTTRFYPVLSDGPKVPGKSGIDLIERHGYAPNIQEVVDEFLNSFDDPSNDGRKIFSLAVVAAWAMLTHRRAIGAEPIDPGRLFEMDEQDAVIFVHRMVRLVGGLEDLPQDADGCYLLSMRSTDQPDSTESDSADGPLHEHFVASLHG